MNSNKHFCIFLILIVLDISASITVTQKDVVLFTDQHSSLRWQEIKREENGTEIISKILVGLTNITSFDYSQERDILVCCKGNSILLSKLSGLINNSMEQNNIRIPVKDRCGALSYDSVNNMVYYHSIELKKIVSIDVNSRQITNVVDIGDNIVGNIEVDPYSSYLFWSQWNNDLHNSKLLRVNLLNTEEISEMIDTILIGYPYAFTIDPHNRTIYIVNSHKCQIVSADYDGKAKIMMISNHYFSAQTMLNAIQYINGSLYFYSYEEESILSFNISNTSEFSRVANIERMQNFKIVHEYQYLIVESTPTSNTPHDFSNNKVFNFFH